MIYYVEDDSWIRELVVYTLKNSGMEAVGLSDGKALFAALQTCIPALLLLDIMLPGEDGVWILRRLRQNPETRELPVILLTAKDQEYDKVNGLDAGADDYIAKPFGMIELVARVRAVLRRAGAATEPGKLQAGKILVDEMAHQVFSDGKEVRLTLKEYQLLQTLMKKPGVVLTRDTLLGTIWGYQEDSGTRTVDVHIRTLRQKLGTGGEQIETVRGVGYRMRGKQV